MKKISLVTLYNSDNYGAMLQAFALQQTIRSFGCECEIVQHDRFGAVLSEGNPKHGLKDIKEYSKLILKHPKAIGYFTASLNRRLKNEAKENKKNSKFFRNEFFNNLSCDYYNSIEQIQENPPIADAYVCGSDQIWNPKRFKGAAPFFLDFGDDRITRISYAPSLATDSIPKEMWEQYQKWIKRFSNVSVREKGGSKAIQEATGLTPEVVLDPSLLLNKNEWAKYAAFDDNQKKKYIFCYFLGKENFISAYDSILKLSKKLDADIVVLPKGRHVLALDKTKETQLSGPQAFIGYMMNAEYVMTDSFHGTAFAINFGKQFCSFKPRGNASFEYKFSRIQNILDIVGLSDRFWTEKEEPKTDFIDYKDVSEKLGRAVEESKMYLKHALDSVRDVRGQINSSRLASHQSCTGCTACVYACSQNAISMVQNEEGFWFPEIDEKKCISCGACSKKCPVKQNKNSKNVDKKYYAIYSLDKERRIKGSSGNAFGELVSVIKNQGDSVIYGAAFSDNCYQVTCKSDKEVGLERLQKSKYCESYLGDAIKRINDDLSKGRKVLFCGTPCQVSGIRSVLGQNNNLVLLDFVCHGVPSAVWFETYLKQIEKKYNSKAIKVDFRSNAFGWSPECMEIHFNNGKIYRRTNCGDPWMIDFAANKHLRENCYNCDRCLRSDADITIGDYWAVKHKKNMQNDNTGISVARVQTKVGQNLFQDLLNSNTVFVKELSKGEVDETFVSRSRKVPKDRGEYPAEFPMKPKLSKKNLLLKMYYEFVIRKLKYHM